MAINKTNRLAWIVKTIYKAKKITFEELANKWNEDTISMVANLSVRSLSILGYGTFLTHSA